MKMLDIINGPQNVSAIIQGCMRMPGLTKEAAAEVIRTAYDCGINFFDHATCYGAGDAEIRFSEAFPLTGLKREDIYIQSKCGLCFDRNEFDWTKENILKMYVMRRRLICHIMTGMHFILHQVSIFHRTDLVLGDFCNETAFCF